MMQAFLTFADVERFDSWSDACPVCPKCGAKHPIWGNPSTTYYEVACACGANFSVKIVVQNNYFGILKEAADAQPDA